MGKGTPWGYYQGNRSEYLAIPALSKLGFTIPVPRQEDRFGVDFVVHLTQLEKNTMSPLGKFFGIQIKSDKESLIFDKQDKRDCLYNSPIPFFIGVVSRKNLTLTIYNTLARLCFYWMKGPQCSFKLIPKDTGKGLKAPNYKGGEVFTGKPIIKISLQDQSTAQERLNETKKLQSTMNSWITLENQVLSLKEQEVPIVWRPKTYTTNKPLRMKGADRDQFERIAYFNPKTLPNICVATEIILDSLSCYLADCLNRAQNFGQDFMKLVKEQLDDVHKVRKRSQQIRNHMANKQRKS